MIYNELEERMEPESKDEFVEVLVNAFANGGGCGRTCPWRNDGCEELWPDEKSYFCAVIELAESFGIHVDLSDRKRNKKLKRVVAEMNNAERVITAIGSAESSLKALQRSIELCKRTLGIEIPS